MKVTHLSTNDTKGGAAGSAYRLHHGLQRAGIESQMYVLRKHSNDDTVIKHQQRGDLLRRTYRRLYFESIKHDFRQYRDTRPDGLEPFSDDRALYWLDDITTLKPDIINLHWVANFIDYRHFFGECIGNIPVVWRLSDLNPFTGGCHYDRGCGKYRDACGACPQLGSAKTNDLARAVWNRKQKAFESIDSDQLHFIAQSEWIRDQVKASQLTAKFPVTVIPNGLDTNVFQPRETRGMRSALSIPSDHRVLLFVADSTRNHRKGFDCLQDALSEFDQDNVTLVSIGSHEPELEASTPHIHLGRIESDTLLSVFYSMADLFVIPSRQDNLPNTVLESMACGTPVVGFDTGGIPDMVRPGKTGWLAEVENTRVLRSAITEGLSNDTERNRMSTQCREVVEAEYTLEIQAERYQKIYRRLASDIS